MGKLPTLSDRVRAAWERAGEAAQAAQAAVPPVFAAPELAVAAVEAAAPAAAAGPKLSGAVEARSAEAFHRVITAHLGGKKGPQEQTAKYAKEMAKDLAEAVAIWRRNEDRGGDLMEISPT